MEVWVVSEGTNTVRETGRPDRGYGAGVRLTAYFAGFGSPVLVLAAILLAASAADRQWPVGVTVVISCLGSVAVVAVWVSLCWVRRVAAARYLGVPRSAEVLRVLRSRRTAIGAEARRRYGPEAARLDKQWRRYVFAGRTLIDGYSVSMFAYIGIRVANGSTGAVVCLVLAIVVGVAGGVMALIGLGNGSAARRAAAEAVGVEIKTSRALMQPRPWYLQWCERQGIRPYPFDETSARGAEEPG